AGRTRQRRPRLLCPHPRSPHRMLVCSCSNAVAKWIAWIQNQFAFTTDKRRTGNARMHAPVSHFDGAFKHAAYYALLLPDFALAQHSISVETCQLCAGASAARRAVVSLAGTQDDILAVDMPKLRRTD